MPQYDVLKEFGLGAFLAVAVFGLLFLIIKWTLATTKDILNQAKAERECWRTTIDILNKNIIEHNERAKSFSDTVNEAHKFQREEHKEMITILARINGYKD
jgi:hypothetical protein